MTESSDLALGTTSMSPVVGEVARMRYGRNRRGSRQWRKMRSNSRMRLTANCSCSSSSFDLTMKAWSAQPGKVAYGDVARIRSARSCQSSPNPSLTE